jgi:F5/8 type C domain
VTTTKPHIYLNVLKQQHVLKTNIHRPVLSFLGMSILLFSLMTTSATFGNILQPAVAQTMNCADIPLTSSSVTASGSDGNLPSNVVDNSLSTRWSNQGIGSWIRVDLGSTKTICSVEIAWYRGNIRQSDFVIAVSSDGNSFTNVFSGRSSGTTLNPENYNFADVDARYVRITVNGNTENTYASITEINVIGFGGGSGGGTAEICNNLIDDDLDGLIDTADPDCQTGGGDGVDPFGINKIYPTKTGGEEWYMDMADGQDPRSRPPSMTKNSDGSWRVTSSQVRYNVFTSTGYNPNAIEIDQGVLEQRGYMQSPNDWKNVEMTGYVKMNTGASDNFAWYNRGGRHTGSGYPDGCEGTGYKGDLFYNGRTRIAKEQWHVSYVFSPTTSAVNSIEDRWVGFKYVVYNFQENGETFVKMENWIDNNNNGNWVKIYDYVDRGGWGNEAGECGGAPDQIITWGGPIATFRWDSATSVDVKNLSVREIKPPQ